MKEWFGKETESRRWVEVVSSVDAGAGADVQSGCACGVAVFRPGQTRLNTYDQVIANEVTAAYVTCTRTICTGTKHQR
jgi:hypothetical protein